MLKIQQKTASHFIYGNLVIWYGKIVIVFINNLHTFKTSETVFNMIMRLELKLQTLPR